MIGVPKFVNTASFLIDFPKANLYNSIRFLVTNWPHECGAFFTVRRIIDESVTMIVDAPVAQWKRSRFVIDRLGVRIPSGALENQSRRHGFQRSKGGQIGCEESGRPRLRQDRLMCEDSYAWRGG